MWNDFELRNDMFIFWEGNFRNIERKGWSDIRFGSNKILKIFVREELVYDESLIVGGNREKEKEVIYLKYIFEINLIEFNDLLGEEN